MRSKPIVFLVALALVAAACTSGSDQASDGVESSEPIPSSGDGSPENSPDGSPEAVVDVPVLPILNTVELAEPGTTVEVAGDPRLSGEVSLVGPEGALSSARLEAGSAALSIPAGTNPGRYGLRLGDGEAWGSVTVMDAPGLAVSGAGYVRAGEAPEVEVVVHGVDDGMVAALELRSGDGTVERLVPHPLLGLAPVPATTTVRGLAEGRHRLRLPAGFQGTVRAIADRPDSLADPYAEEQPRVASGDLRIFTCDEQSGITGDLGAPGVVTVRTAGSPYPVRTRTDTGRFQLDLLPGSALISAILDDGSVRAGSPQLVKVACGGLLDLGDLETPVATGPAPGAYLGGMTIDDLWAYTTTVTGDLSFEQEGFADCSVSGQVLEVTFGSSADPWLYTLTLGPPIDTGTYEGSLHLDDIFSGDSADGILSGEIEVGRIDDLDAIGGAFSGTIDGTLGRADIEVRFTCAVFSITGARPAPTGIPAVMSAAAQPRTSFVSQIGGGLSSGDECKKLFINGTQPEGVEGFVELLMDYWATMLMPEVPRVGIVTANDIRALLNLEAQRQLFGVTDGDGGSIDIAGALGSEFLLQLDNRPAGDSWVLSASLYDLEQMRRLAGFDASGATAEATAEAALDRWSEMVEPLARAGICAEFDPESAVVDVGSTQEFTIEVTDLAGEPPDSPEVLEFNSSCGTWQPASGAVDGDTWATTFTAGDEACQEQISATVQAQGTVGEVEAEADTSIQVDALWQFAVTITFQDAHGLITAESTGEFFVEPDFDALIGAGTGFVEGSGEAYCEANGAVTWMPYELVADYQVMVTGGVTERPDNGPWAVEFAPMGFGISSQMTYKTSSLCIEAGTYSNELLGFLGAGVLVGRPHWLNNQPEGFHTFMNPSGEGVTFEETLSGLPEATIRGRLWKAQP